MIYIGFRGLRVLLRGAGRNPQKCFRLDVCHIQNHFFTCAAAPGGSVTGQCAPFGIDYQGIGGMSPQGQGRRPFALPQ